MMNLYKTCIQAFGWNLKELDDTDFDTLVEFIWFKEDANPNVRVIGGKTYVRAKKPPQWL
jgi:hypothetical protein